MEKEIFPFVERHLLNKEEKHIGSKKEKKPTKERKDVLFMI